MTEIELQNKLQELLNLYDETEVVEFKEANTNYDFDKLGKYFSALSNEANLKKAKCGWLVFGVNKEHKIVGSNYRTNLKDLHNLKKEIAKHTSNTTFIEIYPLQTEYGRVILFQIPPAPTGIPTSYKNHYYARNGEELTGLNLEKIERIRSQNQNYDWSAQICEGATIEDLDEEAIKKAKKQAIEKATGRKKEVLENCKNDLEFLDKARITKNGQITNTALILLGKEERVFDLIPFSQSLEIVWVDLLTGQKREGGKFYPPFILSVDNLASQIRISKHDYMERIGGMATTNRRFVPQYQLKSIREALHNCIAHQDYEYNRRVVLEEYPDKLYFKNGGYSKITDQEYEKMIVDTFTPEDYRNEFLAKAMDMINMIERLGSGQKSIFDYAKSVFLPLPDRNSDIPKNRFEYTIYGSKIDEAFAQILQDRKDLDIGMILLLDRVQKYAKEITSQQISREQYKILKKQVLVEGRYPKLYLSAEIMEVLDQKEDYIKNKGFDEIYYIDLIISYMEKYSNALRINISKLLENKLPEDGTNKYEKVSNILRKMKNKEILKVDKTKGFQNSTWKLTSNYKENLNIYKATYKGKK
jgi:ATP-dependent DNA helicase RecG